MPYLKDKELSLMDMKNGDGTIDRPIFEKEPDWACFAYYFGYKIKWDKFIDYKYSYNPYKVTQIYTCTPVYKLGHETYIFSSNYVDDIFKVYEKLNEDGYFDDELKNAWLSLDIHIMFKFAKKKIAKILKKNDKSR